MGRQFYKFLIFLSLLSSITALHGGWVYCDTTVHASPTPEDSSVEQTGDENTPELTVTPPKAKSASDIYLDMLEASLTGKHEDQEVAGTEGKITYGAEKEASSFLITRIMGPSNSAFTTYLNKLSDRNRTEFMRNFLINWANGSYRVKGQVKDKDGVIHQVDDSEINLTHLQTANDKVIRSKFDSLLSKTDNQSFSFILPAVRQKMFNGELPGQSGVPFGRINKKTQSTAFAQWLPLYGDSQKYVLNAHNTGPGGWEVNFQAMPNYSEFEKMQSWFKTSLRHAGKDFASPGHQRMVFPKRTYADPAQLAEANSKLAEIYKNTQAYILLKGQEGMAGIEISSFKPVSTDATLATLSTQRAIIRLEQDRFGNNTHAIEFRGGTKSAQTRRVTQIILASRYASGDFSGLAKSESWKLYDGSPITAESLAQRFHLPVSVTSKALENLTSPAGDRIGKKILRSQRKVGEQYLTPFWQWENAPYLSKEKKGQIEDLTRNFILSVSKWDKPSLNDVRKGLQAWAQASNLSADIESYLQPSPSSPQTLQEQMEFHPVKPGAVDVNQIDLGLELTARYPIHLKANYTKVPLNAQKTGWIGTQYDLSTEERKGVLKTLAENVARELNGKKTPVTYSAEQTHGNSLEMAYEFKDSKNRTVRVEWDGIGRDYDSDGNVIAGSPRSGHIELVTPKFVPSAAEISSVYKVFNKMNLIPSAEAGGGHINVDLAPFEGNPKALARFLCEFHASRGIISLMFQNIGRQKSAEALDISEELAKKLKDFNGTENELKKLLYDEKYFNTRLGRKTRYSQLDLSAYFQDVIPEEFIHEDFDIKNALWRRNFNVNPKVRKAEFRLFNAPADETEAAAQIKLVRALLNKALNETDTPSPTVIQQVDYKKYADNPQLAMADMEKMAKELGLDPADYRRYTIEGLISAKEGLSSPFYKPMEKEMVAFPKLENWGSAVDARSAEDAISAEGRVGIAPEDPSAQKLLEDRKSDRIVLENERKKTNKDKITSGQLDRNRFGNYLENYYVETKLQDLPDSDFLYGIFIRKDKKNGPEALAELEKLKESNPLKLDRVFNSALGSKDPDFLNWLQVQIKSVQDVGKFSSAVDQPLKTRVENAINNKKPASLADRIGDVLKIPISEQALSPKRMLPSTEKSLIASSNPALRQLGYERLKSLKPDEFINIVYNAVVYTKDNDIIRDGLFQVTKFKASELSDVSKTTLKSWANVLLRQADPKMLSLAVKVALLSEDPTLKASIENKAFSTDSVHVIISKQVLDTKGVDTTGLALNLLRSPSEEARRIALQSLVKRTLPSLQSEDPKIRAEAYAKMQASSNNASAIEFLVASGMQRSSIDAQRDFYEYVDSKIGNADKIPPKLEDILKNAMISSPDPSIRGVSAHALNQVAPDIVEAHVREGLHSPDTKTRQRASELLSSLTSTPFAEIAAEHLLDVDAVVQSNARKVFTDSKNVRSDMFEALLKKELTSNSAEKKVINELLNTIKSKPGYESSLNEAMLKSDVVNELRLSDLIKDASIKFKSSTYLTALESPSQILRKSAYYRLKYLSDAEFLAATQNFKVAKGNDQTKDFVEAILKRDFKNPEALANYRRITVNLINNSDRQVVELGASLYSKIPANENSTAGTADPELVRKIRTTLAATRDNETKIKLSNALIQLETSPRRNLQLNTAAELLKIPNAEIHELASRFFSQQGITPLAAVYVEDSNPAVRKNAEAALLRPGAVLDGALGAVIDAEQSGFIKNKSVITQLIRKMSSDPAFGSMLTPLLQSSTDSPYAERIRSIVSDPSITLSKESLIVAINSKNALIRKTALYRIKSLGESQFVAITSQGLSDSSDSDATLDILTAIRNYRNGELLTNDAYKLPAAAVISSENSGAEAKKIATDFLKNFAIDEEVSAHLRTALGSESIELKMAAAAVLLERRNDPLAVKVAQEFRDEEDSLVNSQLRQVSQKADIVEKKVSRRSRTPSSSTLRSCLANQISQSLN